MSQDSDRVDKTLGDFLEEGPHEIDEAVIEAALARISTTPQRSRVGGRWSVPRSWVAAAAVLLLVTSGLVARQLASPSPSPVGSPSPTAGWPVGGPVPPGISGTWRAHNADPGAFRTSLILNGNGYRVGGSTMQPGNVVVNGDTMLFFNGSGCQLALPAGIGTYRWSLSGTGILTLQLVSDPCGRVGVLGDSTWDRIR